MKTLYYDCFSGISGDLHLGALIDVGVPAAYVLEELHKLGVSEEFTCHIEKGVKDGISGTKVKVVDHHNDHESAAHHHHHGLKGFVAGIRHKLVHDHHHHHSDEHGHTHSHGSEHHHGRTFGDIRKLIQTSGLSSAVKDLSIAIFHAIAVAEGAVHGKDPEEVHFHEVGAIDSIVDIVGAAICLDYLQVDRIVSSPIEVGQGMIQCAHGTLPVPAPATALLLQGIPIVSRGVPFEATTPTGAAIIKTVVQDFTAERSGTIEAVGYGLGEKHNPAMPNVLRVYIMESDDEERTRDYVVEANMDDMPGEGYDLLMSRLFELGAYDVYMTPILMKKQRPAVTLSVLCDSTILEAVKGCIFKNSTTIGLRYYEVERQRLDRRERIVDTPWGPVPVKEAFYEGELVNQKPEYDACKAIAIAEGLTLQEVQQAVQERLREK